MENQNPTNNNEVHEVTGEAAAEAAAEAVEQEMDITEILSEEVTPHEEVDRAEVSESDFNVDETGTEKKEPDDPALKKEPEKEKAKPEPTAEEKKIEKKETAEANKTNSAVRRMFNPDTALLMLDIMLKRGGRIAMPDRPDYFRMTEEDKDDFKVLLSNTAQEEDWSGIPSKWLLAAATFFWAFGKYYKWNKPHLWDEQEAGKHYVKKGDTHEVKKDEAFAEYIRERAKADADSNTKALETMLHTMLEKDAQRSRQLQNLMDMIAANIPGAQTASDSGIQDVKFEEIAPERYVDNYDMEIITFSPGNCIVDRSKAGLPGYAPDGRKDGKPSRRCGEIKAHWEKYQAYKKRILKVVA